MTRFEAVAEQTAAFLARPERLVETGFAKVEDLRDEILADDRNSRRLIGWMLFGFFATVYGTIGLAAGPMS